LNPATRKESLVRRRREDYNRCGRVGRKPEHEVEYYAHTAVGADGKPDRNPAKWQLLSTHLRGANDLVKQSPPRCDDPFHWETRDHDPEDHGLPSLPRTVFDESQSGIEGNQELS
jgi:hypothetical protein